MNMHRVLPVKCIVTVSRVFGWWLQLHNSLPWMIVRGEIRTRKWPVDVAVWLVEFCQRVSSCVSRFIFDVGWFMSHIGCTGCQPQLTPGQPPKLWWFFPQSRWELHASGVNNSNNSRISLQTMMPFYWRAWELLPLNVCHARRSALWPEWLFVAAVVRHGVHDMFLHTLWWCYLAQCLLKNKKWNFFPSFLRRGRKCSDQKNNPQ